MLKTEQKEYYQVKQGQTLKEIARYFCVSEFLLVKENGLLKEPCAGEILKIPQERGNAYFAQEWEEKKLLCGSEENYEKRNGTTCLYPLMRIIL